MSKRKQPESTEIVQAAKPLPPVERTAEGLRDALFDELNLLRTGNATTAHARAVANLCRLIIETARLEYAHVNALIEANKLMLGSK